jgi:hypothetical protein
MQGPTVVTRLVRDFAEPFFIRDDHYRVRVYAERREDGRWEGWLEFVANGSGEVIMTGRETTQSNLPSIRYWAGGLRPTYLEGALDRARRRFGRSILSRPPQ